MNAFSPTLSYEYMTPEVSFPRTIYTEKSWTRRPYAKSQSTTNEYFAFPEDTRFTEHFVKLESLETTVDPCVDQTEVPSKDAIRIAKMILQSFQLDSVVPSVIVPSADGGIAICFANGDKYADIECLNSGEILGVITNRRDRPFVWEVRQTSDDIARASAKIGQFIGTLPTKTNASRRQKRGQ